MKFSVDRQEKYTILKFDEERLDTTLAPDVKSEVTKLDSDGVESLILNLENVKYIDSSGLSALLVANRLFGGEKGMLVICHIQSYVMKLIRISMLHKLLSITNTQEEAVELVFMENLERGLNEEQAQSE